MFNNSWAKPSKWGGYSTADLIFVLVGKKSIDETDPEFNQKIQDWLSGKSSEFQSLQVQHAGKR